VGLEAPQRHGLKTVLLLVRIKWQHALRTQGIAPWIQGLDEVLLKLAIIPDHRVSGDGS
jgi:hypothetical protein